jgi:hypothetical protein
MNSCPTLSRSSLPARTLEGINGGILNQILLSLITFPANLSEGFLDRFDAGLELLRRRGRLTLRGRRYTWPGCVAFPGKAFLQLICDFLFDHVLNGIGKRR